MPSSALLRRLGPVAVRGRGPLALLDPLPLAVDVRCGLRLGLAEDMGVAADDLGGDRRPDVGHVEHALLRGELRVENDLEQQVAELARELRRRAGRRARRRPRTPPRAGGCAVTRCVCSRSQGQPSGARSRSEMPGHAPWRGGVGDGREGREVERAGRGRAPSGPRPSYRPGCRTFPPDGPPGRGGGQPRAESDRPRRADPAGPREGRLVVGEATRKRAAGTTSTRDRRFHGRGDQPLRDDQGEAGRRVQAPAEPGLGEERVQHRIAARSGAASARGAGDPASRVMSNSAFCCEYQSGKAELSSAARCLASGSRVSSLLTRNR